MVIDTITQTEYPGRTFAFLTHLTDVVPFSFQWSIEYQLIIIYNNTTEQVIKKLSEATVLQNEGELVGITYRHREK